MSVRRQRYRRKDGTQGEHWIVDVVVELADGRTVRRKKVSPVQTKRGAQKYERDLRDAILREDGVPNRKEVCVVPTLAEFAERFIDKKVRGRNKPSEVAKKEQILSKHLVPELGKRRLDCIAGEDVDGYVSKKLEQEYRPGTKYSPKTINNHLAVLRRILAVAVEWRVIEWAPKVQALPVDESKFDFFDFEESERLVDAAGDWRPAISFTLNTGLRLGELRALNWSSVDLTNCRVRVIESVWQKRAANQFTGSPKNHRSRVVELNDRAVAAVRDLPTRFAGKLVFGTTAGELQTVAAFEWGLERACRVAGLRKVGWHSLRHTFASHLAMRGVPIKSIQELLGHSDIRMTMRYAHLAPASKREAVRALDIPTAKPRPNGVRRVVGE